MSELEQKIEDIHFLLGSNIEQMNKIVAEANDPQKKAKEAQILIEASKSINYTLGEFSGLISKEKQLLDGFKPEVIVKHETINMKNPINWVVSCVVCCVISLGTAFFVYRLYESEKLQKEQYKKESQQKDDNYMKYKWLGLFGSRETINALKAFDADYAKNWKTYDNEVRNRERELDEARAARNEAETMAANAKRLKQHADSLQNAK